MLQRELPAEVRVHEQPELTMAGAMSIGVTVLGIITVALSYRFPELFKPALLLILWGLLAGVLGLVETLGGKAKGLPLPVAGLVLAIGAFIFLATHSPVAS